MLRGSLLCECCLLFQRRSTAAAKFCMQLMLLSFSYKLESFGVPMLQPVSGPAQVYKLAANAAFLSALEDPLAERTCTGSVEVPSSSYSSSDFSSQRS